MLMCTRYGLVQTNTDIFLSGYFPSPLQKKFRPHDLRYTKYLCTQENAKTTTNAQTSTY